MRQTTQRHLQSISPLRRNRRIYDVAWLAASLFWASSAVSAESVFEARIGPIFKQHCLSCHGDRVRKAGLDLRTLTAIATGGESGTVVDLARPKEGILYEYVVQRHMPPEDEGQLSDGQVQVIQQWLEGAAVQEIGQFARHLPNQHEILYSLRVHCTVCHGARRQEAGLDLRSVESMLRGGKSGPAISWKRPADSLLLKRIHDGEMPPPRKLATVSVKPFSERECERLAAWVRAGGPTDDVRADVASGDGDPLVADDDRHFWAFQPPRMPAPPDVVAGHLVRTPIDRFLLAKLERVNLSFSDEVPRSTLIRRVFFDLLGVPPSPEEVDAFVRDQEADAYERMVDRVLASPHYGERWGQYWLDLAGYCDSEGVQNADPIRKHAWRYRDYVIRSWNADVGYDYFLRQQIAGDELSASPVGPGLTQKEYDNLVATGFLRMAPDGSSHPITSFVPDRLEVIDDEIEIFSSAILGLTLKCARCHTHKFDPIPQRDYYRFAAIFKGAWDEHDWLATTRQDGVPGTRDRYLPFALQSELDQWMASGAKPENQPLIRALWDRGEPTPTYILERGNYQTPGKLVGPGVPSVLTDGKTPFHVSAPFPGKTGRRLALANWLVQPDHPLTSRVIVNRVWRHHFGRGIVETLDNFGTTGARPTHRELLDWLALQLMRDRWSLKSLHRVILRSAAYRQSSKVTQQHRTRDPDNMLLSRMPLRRLEGEVARDAILSVAGCLDRSQFGSPDPIKTSGTGLVSSVSLTESKNSSWRRSVYLLKRRTHPVTFLQNFDVPGMSPNCVERSESIVATQALHLTNNTLVHAWVKAFAGRVWRQAGNDSARQLQLAGRLAFGRSPTPEELVALSNGMKKLRSSWSVNGGVRTEIEAETGLWIREIEPSKVYENDLISVWSSASRDKGRRIGIIEFDLSGLEGLDLTAAHLELGVLKDQAIVQHAVRIDPGVEGLTWQRYVREKAENAVPFHRLGRLPAKSGDHQAGQYAASEVADADDLAQVMNVVAAQGRLAIALIAAEDGSAYACDWDDGVHRTTAQNPPKLVFYDSRSDSEFAARRALEGICHALINSAAFLYVD